MSSLYIDIPIIQKVDRMVILISPEKNLTSEIGMLHDLFDAGLQYYHLRKPDFNEKQYHDYLRQIAPEHLKHVMIHSHHHISEKIPVKGIHLEERVWREKEHGLSSYVDQFRNKGFNVSSSYHELHDLERQVVAFDYYMLSPVFGAISKPGYKGRGFDVSHSTKPIVGMGGITAKTTPAALALGFTGVGTLGGIWNAVDPVKAFTEIQEAYLKNTAS